MNTDCVIVSTVVAVDPATAFSVFTKDIALWWKPKVRGLFRQGQCGTLVFRDDHLWEVYPDDAPFEIGRILAWEPPRKLVVEWRQGSFAEGECTEVEVRFEQTAGGTRVTVEHRGWDSLASGHPARHGYTGNAFTSIIGLRWADALTSLRWAYPIPGYDRDTKA